MISGSGLQRAFECEASYRLPLAPEPPPHAGTEKGKDAHAALEQYALGEKVDPKWRDLIEACEEAGVFGSGKRWAEQAFYFHRGECVPLDIKGRNYGALPPGAIPFTVDLITGQPWSVTDYKTGHYEVAPAARNWQLRIAAIGARALGASDVVSRIVRINDACDGISIDEAYLEPFDIDGHIAELTSLQARVASKRVGEPDTNPGPHCQYCRAFVNCPAQRQALALFAPQFLPVAGKDAARIELTTANAINAYEWLGVARKMLDALEAEINRLVLEAGPISGPDGVLALESKVAEFVDLDKAMPVLIEAYGQETASQCTKATISKESIKDALRKLELPRGWWKGTEQTLRDAGAFTVRESMRLKLDRG